MTLQTPELQVVLDRLARLERQNRRLRRIVVAGIFLSAGALIASQVRRHGRIEAREFVLRDASGAVRATLAVNAGEPRLTLLDSHQNLRAVLAPEQFASGNAAKVTEAEPPRVMPVSATATRRGDFEPALENSEPRLARAGFSSLAGPGGGNVHQGAPVAGLAIFDALHPLIPALVTVRNDDANVSGTTAIGPKPQPRGNQSIGDSGGTLWRSGALLADLFHAPRFDVDNHGRSMPAARNSAAAISPASVETHVGRTTPPSPHPVEIETAVPKAPADLPLVKWGESRAFQTAQGARVARNPFEFAGQPPRITSPRSARSAEKIPAAASESLPAAPPVALKALGYAESVDAAPQAIISDDVNIYVVRAGDSFAGRFQVVAIDPTGVDIDDRLAGRSLRLTFTP